MYVKDLKVGAMYRIKDHPTGPRAFCRWSACDSVYVSRETYHHKGVGTKMVYLGTRVVGYEEGVWSKRFKNNTQRIGLFGDKVLAIEPEAWKHIEPVEEA